MLARFMTTIPVEGNNVEFEFQSMNIKRLQLFQVYVSYEGERHRFHVQIYDNSEFQITDPAKCPAPYRGLSKAFSDAIYAHCREN